MTEGDLRAVPHRHRLVLDESRQTVLSGHGGGDVGGGGDVETSAGISVVVGEMVARWCHVVQGFLLGSVWDAV